MEVKSRYGLSTTYDTNDKWFGVTYKEDKDYVVKSFVKLIEDGVYHKNLFEDLK